jgi:hypothetical protein
MTCNPIITRRWGDDDEHIYSVWCRACGWETDETTSHQVAAMRAAAHREGTQQ